MLEVITFYIFTLSCFFFHLFLVQIMFIFLGYIWGMGSRLDTLRIVYHCICIYLFTEGGTIDCNWGGVEYVQNVLAWHMDSFWDEGNWDPADSGKAFFASLITVKKNLDRGLYQKELLPEIYLHGIANTCSPNLCSSHIPVKLSPSLLKPNSLPPSS